MVNEDLNAAFDAEAYRQLKVSYRELFEQLEAAREGLHEIIREFREGKPRGYEGPDTYEEDDPVVIIARRALGDSSPASEPN
jgi:hypothetical protein